MSTHLAFAPLMLQSFVSARREELIARTRAKVAQRCAPKPTDYELTSGVPIFLDQLAMALGGKTPPSAATTHSIKASASTHGGLLLKKGFTVAQVVHDYGDICQAVTELADEVNEPITTEEFHTLNLCLDNAIAEAVTAFTAQHEKRIADDETKRAGAFAHELRNRLSGATLGFAMIRSGTTAVGGSVAQVVARNLERMKTLIDRSLVDVRIDSGNATRERVALREIIEQAEVDGAIEATTHGLSFSVAAVAEGTAIDVDPQILASTLANILENAFHFTPPGGHVSLRAAVADNRVEIEVEDECGGLPVGKADELGAAFGRHGRDRSGLGLGLFISRKGIEACGGALRVRDVPKHGCIFTIDLPVLA